MPMRLDRGDAVPSSEQLDVLNRGVVANEIDAPWIPDGQVLLLLLLVVDDQASHGAIFVHKDERVRAVDVAVNAAAVGGDENGSVRHRRRGVWELVRRHRHKTALESHACRHRQVAREFVQASWDVYLWQWRERQRVIE